MISERLNASPSAESRGLLTEPLLQLRDAWIIPSLALVAVTFGGMVLGLLPATDGLSVGDFRVFYEAAARLQRSEPIYRPDLLAYMNPPFFAWALQPLTWISFPVARLLWVAITYGLTGVSCALLLGAGRPTARRRFWLWATLLSAPVLLGNVVIGQSTALVLLGLALNYALERSGRHVLAGAALGLVLVKPHLILGPAIALLVMRNWKTLFGLVASSSALSLLSIFLVGTTGLADYLNVARDVTGWVRLEPFFRLDMHTPNGVLHTFVPQAADIAVVVVGGAVAGLLAWRAHGVGVYTPEVASLAVVASLLIAPYAHLHDLMLLAVPWLLQGPRVVGRALWVLVASYVAPVLHLVVLGLGGYGPLLTVLVLAGLFVVSLDGEQNTVAKALESGA